MVKVIIGKRKVTKSGTNSLAIVIPAIVVQGIKLKAGDEVDIVWDNADKLTVTMPLKEA
jgi:antitoxin component of MazEF toxin-antitoxin module